MQLDTFPSPFHPISPRVPRGRPDFPIKPPMLSASEEARSGREKKMRGQAAKEIVEGNADVADPSPFSVGSASVIGRRDEMEDTVAVVPGFATIAGELHGFFAVYDGHGGSADVAVACRDRMHVVVAQEAARSPPPPPAAEGSEEWWRAVMERSFERVDAEVAGVNKRVGSTAVVAVVGPRLIVVANCGDCRAVMGRDGEALALSSDHKPNRADERERVEKGGGWIVDWHGFRVLGVLAISRSLGDYDLKPFVTSTPELTFIDRTENDEFLILASDGLWDVVSNNSACRVVKNCLTGRTVKKYPDHVSSNSADMAATLLTQLALLKSSTDNVSAVVVQFKDLVESAPAEMLWA